MSNIHTGFNQETIDQLDQLFRRWTSLDNAADWQSYENEAANAKAAEALAAYDEALEAAVEMQKASHLAACMLEQGGEALRMARWNVEAVQ